MATQANTKPTKANRTADYTRMIAEWNAIVSYLQHDDDHATRGTKNGYNLRKHAEATNHKYSRLIIKNTEAGHAQDPLAYAQEQARLATEKLEVQKQHKAKLVRQDKGKAVPPSARKSKKAAAAVDYELRINELEATIRTYESIIAANDTLFTQVQENIKAAIATKKSGPLTASILSITNRTKPAPKPEPVANAGAGVAEEPSDEEEEEEQSEATAEEEEEADDDEADDE